MTVPPAFLAAGPAGALLADVEIDACFTRERELAAMVAFERALARAQHAAGVIDAAALAAAEQACDTVRFDQAALLEGLGSDGLIVPAFVRQLRAAAGEAHGPALHKGTTSQDVIDTALMLRLRDGVGILAARLEGVLADLDAFAARHGGQGLMARTRMQDALPFTLADKVATWRAPLADLASERPRRFPLQLAGPIGLRAAAFGPHHEAIAAHMAAALGLTPMAQGWHTDRRAVLAILRWCVDVTTALGKIGQDVALMTQTAVAELHVEGGGSSAMAHKNNPVVAERLVTLARFAAGQLAILEGAGVHENERSGAAWTLEWLVVPPVFSSCGSALCAAQVLFSTMRTSAR